MLLMEDKENDALKLCVPTRNSACMPDLSEMALNIIKISSHFFIESMNSFLEHKLVLAD